MRTAEQINTAMDALSTRLNHVSELADQVVVKTLNGLLSDWQDFYWSQLEQWPVNDLQRWENNLNDMTVALTRLEHDAGTVDQPVSAPPSSKVTTLPAISITGTWPTWMKVGAAAMLGFALYKAARKLHLL